MHRTILRYSPIKSGTGFTLFALCVSASGYFGIDWYHTRKYDHPIVSEAVRLLQNNDQIVKLAGYPLNLKVRLSSEAITKDNACHFTFQVIGPKGAANVDLIGKSKELKDIGDQKAAYYIPSLDQVIDLLDGQHDEAKLKSTPLDPSTKFWKIDQLVADVGLQGDFRVVLIDANKVINKSIASLPMGVVTNRATLADLKEEIDSRRPQSPKTEQEMEEARRYRQQQVYRKVGGIRLITFGMALLGGMAVYNYVRQHKRISVLNTSLHQQSLQLIQQHQQVRKLFGNHMKFNNQLRGGQVGDEAEFETDIYGQRLGTAFVKGIKDQATNDWKIESIEIATKSTEGEVQEKFKIW